MIPKAPDCNKFSAAHETLLKEDGREPMYTVAAAHIRSHWSDAKDIADGVAVLVLGWTGVFYNRFGSFNQQALRECIRTNLASLNSFRERDIFTFSPEDVQEIKRLFREFQSALRARFESKKCAVATAKGLHLLAPRYFPIWDRFIAKAYGCAYTNANAAERYVDFCFKIQEMSKSLKTCPVISDQPLLKQIDDYNFVTYTLPAIERQRELERQRRKKRENN